jgi:hypothetical protein
MNDDKRTVLPLDMSKVFDLLRIDREAFNFVV